MTLRIQAVRDEDNFRIEHPVSEYGIVMDPDNTEVGLCMIFPNGDREIWRGSAQDFKDLAATCFGIAEGIEDPGALTTAPDAVVLDRKFRA